METIDIASDPKDIELGYVAIKSDEEAGDGKEHEVGDSIQVPTEKRYHLSDVNLLRPNYAHKKEELEVSHSLADHIVIENLAGQIFKEWDVSNDGEISAEDLTDSGFDRDFGEALGRVLDCDKSGRIVREGMQMQL
jgi:hypothetical protein